MKGHGAGLGVMETSSQPFTRKTPPSCPAGTLSGGVVKIGRLDDLSRNPGSATLSSPTAGEILFIARGVSVEAVTMGSLIDRTLLPMGFGEPLLREKTNKEEQIAGRRSASRTLPPPIQVGISILLGGFIALNGFEPMKLDSLKKTDSLSWEL
ncbi:Polyphosphoinositide Phosphatase [Manis pentadactyla]|nr:Polyphosphoinositide Phosphatase [Manis pentadactyla]